ncbi:phage antirepressor KilAC domain-containing protein [Acinetobacter bereziniae]|uniref:phage antirepressor KilAC domain-containing protein n=1 Tax=Acinetobacter bereziniae TaxID=106648 RepID=UPI0021D296BC|nr:phage antirepressor KilAC domain-containing protein [Acinetobacter bereziniae]MCU4317216.1 phage antirepressor KilAC domain-containing protein [Acinetobacter bereziniae]
MSNLITEHINPLSNQEKSSPDFSLSMSAKLLNLSPKVFIQLLCKNKFIFKRSNQTAWESYQNIVDREILRHRVINVQHSTGLIVPHLQVRVTLKGLSYFKNRFCS